MILEIKGHVPSKANEWRHGKGRTFIPPGTARDIAALQLQLNILWSGKEPLIHPDITLEFHLKNPMQDKDGALKTTLDILKVAGVIVDDSIKFCNGWLHIAPAVISKDEKVLIELKEATNGGKQRDGAA